MNLTRSGEYALAALSRLALLSPDGKLVTVDALAAAQGVPRPFLAKLMQQCARAGLIRSRPGADGGIALARRPEDVTVLSIIEACEGPCARDACVFYAQRPCAGPQCENLCPLRSQEDRLRDGLEATTLADMARALANHPDARSANVSAGGDQWTRR